MTGTLIARSVSQWLRRRAACLTVLFAAACHAQAPVAEPKGPVTSVKRPPPTAKAKANALDVPALHATELGRVQSPTFGPYLGMRPDGALVVWAALEGGERRFSAAPLSAQGRPLSRASVLGDAPEELGVVAVRSLSDGYAVLFTRPGDKSEAVEALCVSANGQAHGGANRLAELPGRALWVELVPVEQGAIAFYAARSSEKQKAELWAVAIDSQCRVVERNLVFKNALAWQAAPAPRGAFLSVVQPGDATGGVVSVAVLDATSKLKSTTKVTSEAGADLDLDAVSLGDRLLLAWTDQRRFDTRVLSAVVDANGKVVAAPERLTAPEGDQALVRLVPPSAEGKRAFVAFERLEARPASGRYFSLSALNELGRLTGSRVELGYANDDGGMPELAAVGDALVALTLSPLCRRGAACEASDVAPTYVRFDEALTVVATEPLRLEPLAGKHAELGFGLGCTRSNCIAISALSRVPAQIFATELEGRSRAWAAPVRDIEKPAPPRVKEFESIAWADSVAALSAANSAGQDWLGFITDFDDTAPWKLLSKPAADGRREPLRAKIGLLRMTASNPRAVASDSPIVVSERAHSVGGVAIAPGDAARGDVAVAWAGLDNGVPQLFLTLFDKAGAKVVQRMVTHKKGELSDVALGWVGDGWVVAWVDERSGDPEVYAAKLDTKLNRTSPEQRITNAEGAASDLTLAFDGTSLRLAWSDGRGADASEHADIYTVRLRVRDAAREGSELRVAPTRAHSFAPALYPHRGGFALGWIERGDDSNGRLAFADIAADGSAGALATVQLPEAAEPRALALDCPESGCRFLAIAESHERSDLLAGVWDGAKVEKLSRVLALSSGSSVKPSLRGDVALVADRDADGTRIRRLQLQW